MNLSPPVGWQTRHLAECLDTIIDYRGKSPRKTDVGIPLITARVVKAGRILPPDEFIDESDYEDWMRRGMPKRGDVLVTTEAPLGEVAQLTEERVALAQRIVALRASPETIDEGFLKYSMQSPFVQAQLRARATGSTVLGIRQSELKQVLLAFPSLPQQKAIAEVLGCLDDKINLNGRMNAMQEAMARALFQSAFIDFEPARAKEKGWRTETLGQVATINDGKAGKDFPHAEIQYIDISSVSTGRLDGMTRFSWTEAPSRAQRLVQQGDTIWSCVRPNRRSFLFIDEPAPDVVVSTGFVVLRPRAVTPSFLYAWVTADEFVDYLTSNADGSAYPAVRPDDFARAEVLVPDMETLEKFEEIVAPMRKLIARNERESRTLAALRDALLPKLMSGEAHVRP